MFSVGVVSAEEIFGKQKPVCGNVFANPYSRRVSGVFRVEDLNVIYKTCLAANLLVTNKVINASSQDENHLVGVLNSISFHALSVKTDIKTKSFRFIWEYRYAASNQIIGCTLAEFLLPLDWLFENHVSPFWVNYYNIDRDPISYRITPILNNEFYGKVKVIATKDKRATGNCINKSQPCSISWNRDWLNGSSISSIINRFNNVVPVCRREANAQRKKSADSPIKCLLKTAMTAFGEIDASYAEKDRSNSEKSDTKETAHIVCLSRTGALLLALYCFLFGMIVCFFLLTSLIGWRHSRNR